MKGYKWWESGTLPNTQNMILSQYSCFSPCNNTNKTVDIQKSSHYTCWFFISRYILTSHDFSWLQKGQVNWDSRSPVIFFLGGGFLFDLRRPIVPKLSNLREKRQAEHTASKWSDRSTPADEDNLTKQSYKLAAAAHWR